MSRIYDVIVIGAGPGGMGCAAQLAKLGMKTLVIDKNPRVGGLMQRYTKQGYTFDFGVMAGLPGSEGRWEALFKKLDIPHKYKVVMLPMEMAYRDPKTRQWRHWVNDWSDALNPESIFDLLGCTPEEKQQALVAATKMWEINQDPNKLAALEETTLQEFVEEMDFPWPVASQIYMFSNGGVIHARELVAASEAVPIYLKFREGIAYPLGGFGRLSEILGERCKELGVEFLMKTRVDKINIKGTKVTGVSVKGGEEFESPIVVSDAGIQATVLKLVGEKYFDKSYVSWVKQLIPSMGFTRCNYILSKPVLKYGFYQIFSDESWWDVKRYNDAREGIVPGDVTISIVVNSNYDPSLAPPGKQIMQVGSNASSNPKDPHIKLIWDRTDELVAEVYPEILPYLESKEGYIGPAEASARSRDSAVPGQGGEICGTAQVVGQVGKHKPKAQSPVAGLFYVGVDAEGGPYMCSEQAVDSALKVAPKVYQYHLKRQSAYWPR